MIGPAKTAPWLVLVVVLGLTNGAGGQRSDQVADRRPGQTETNADEWITYGRDYAETHYSPLTQINASNVSRLGLAWTWETGSPTESSTPTGAALQATPLVSDGAMYGTLAWSVVFAVETRTGRPLWRWDPQIPREKILGLCCGPKNRGVALYDGKVFAGLLDGAWSPSIRRRESWSGRRRCLSRERIRS